MTSKPYIYKYSINLSYNMSAPIRIKYRVFVDPRLTVVTVWRVPRVYNTADDRQTSASRQAPTKTYTKRTISELRSTTLSALQYSSLTSALLLRAGRRV